MSSERNRKNWSLVPVQTSRSRENNGEDDGVEEYYGDMPNGEPIDEIPAPGRQSHVQQYTGQSQDHRYNTEFADSHYSPMPEFVSNHATRMQTSRAESAYEDGSAYHTYSGRAGLGYRFEHTSGMYTSNTYPIHQRTGSATSTPSRQTGRVFSNHSFVSTPNYSASPDYPDVTYERQQHQRPSTYANERLVEDEYDMETLEIARELKPRMEEFLRDREQQREKRREVENRMFASEARALRLRNKAENEWEDEADRENTRYTGEDRLNRGSLYQAEASSDEDQRKHRSRHERKKRERRRNVPSSSYSIYY